LIVARCGGQQRTERVSSRSEVGITKHFQKVCAEFGNVEQAARSRKRNIQQPFFVIGERDATVGR
jgi:hypothetical protein